MDNTHKYAESQEKNDGMLHIPSSLHGFRNITTTTREAKSGRTVFCLDGEVEIPEEERICACGCHMHIPNPDKPEKTFQVA